MAANIESGLEFIAVIAIEKKEYLNSLRIFSNLKIAPHSENIWIRGFTDSQLNSIELKSIPFIEIYTSKANRLTKWGENIPIKSLPTLLWTPIKLAITVELPKLNVNFFGLDFNYTPKLIPSEIEQNATAIVSYINDAHKYISEASSHRLAPIQWILIETKKVIFIGEPLLPIKGQAYWIQDRFIIPVGFQLENNFLQKAIATKMDESNLNYIWWVTEFEFVLIEKSLFTPLSISSWTKTIAKHISYTEPICSKFVPL